MDDREYRRLCVDALRGRLDDATRRRWEAHGRANPECARFFAHLAASDASAAARMTPASSAAPPMAIPLEEEEASRADTRRLAYWGPVAVLVGALVAGVGALLIFGPDPGARGKAISIERSNAPRNVDDRDRPLERGVDSTSQPERLPVKPPTDTPRKPDPPLKEPPKKLPVVPPVIPRVEPTGPSKDPPADPPKEMPAEPAVEKPAPLAQVLKLGGKEPQYRLQSASGAPRFLREAAGLSRGDRVRLMSGRIDVVIDGLALQCTERAEFRVITGVGRAVGAHFDYGTYIADAIHLEEPRLIALEHAKIELHRAAVMIRADWGQTTMHVLQGEVTLTHDKAAQLLAAGDSVLIEPGRMSVPAPGKADWDAMDNQWLGPRETLLRASFDKGPGSFDIGVVEKAGARHSPGALAWDKARPGVGCGEKGPVFVPAANSRLRFRVRTNSPQLRVQVQVLIEGKWQTASLALTPASGGKWQLLDVPLRDLRAGPGDSQDGFVPGVDHRALQFRYRYPDNRILPSERFLVIDDVEVYTPAE